jgi:hypothetical protein
MPTRYGSVPVSEWKSQWLLEEENAQMRSFLIREIGWEKIVEELQSNEIDTWKEYQLITFNRKKAPAITVLRLAVR